MKKANRSRFVGSEFGVFGDGVHAIADLFGTTTRVSLKLKDKLITTTRVINSEIKQIRLKTLFEQNVCGDPSRNTKGPIHKFVEFARDRCMLREIGIASKKVTGRARDRKAKGIQRGVAPIYFGASA